MTEHKQGAPEHDRSHQGHRSGAPVRRAWRLMSAFGLMLAAFSLFVAVALYVNNEDDDAIVRANQREALCRLAETKARIVDYVVSVRVVERAETDRARDAALTLLRDFHTGSLELERRAALLIPEPPVGCEEYDVHLNGEIDAALRRYGIIK